MGLSIVTNTPQGVHATLVTLHGPLGRRGLCPPMRPACEVETQAPGRKGDRGALYPPPRESSVCASGDRKGKQDCVVLLGPVSTRILFPVPHMPAGLSAQGTFLGLERPHPILNRNMCSDSWGGRACRRRGYLGKLSTFLSIPL